MAYAIIVWDPPEGSDPDEVALLINSVLDDVSSGIEPLHFLDRAVLYPSPKGGVGFSKVRDTLEDLITEIAGLNILIIMPDESSTVAGWLSNISGNMEHARTIMNQSGTPKTFPRIL